MVSAKLDREADMRVYVANFGRENWAWPRCWAQNTIAMMEDVWAYPLWGRQDRDGYLRETQLRCRLPDGRQVPKQVASRWFNLHREFRETTNDVWIHRAGEELWWTLSTDAPPSEEIIDDPRPRFEEKRILRFSQAVPGLVQSKPEQSGRESIRKRGNFCSL